MRLFIGLFVLFLLSTSASAQYPYRYQEYAPAPAAEDCPQGREIRAQKHYPASMTDCQVLDADTAAENGRLGTRRPPAQHDTMGPSSARLPPAPGYADLPQNKRVHKPNYVSVEAENGAVIKVDMNSIERGDGAAIVFTYADEGRPEDVYNLQGYMFDCQGHYELMGLHSSPSMYAPPRSVAARISELACSVPIGTEPK